jgi:hypothetical protein
MAAFWLDDPVSAFTKDNALDFTPIAGSSMTERLNAMFRFSVYFGLVAAVVARDYRYLAIPLIVGPITIVAHRSRQVSPFEPSAPCSTPTQNNPFMNILMSDYENPRRPAACNALEPATQCQIEKLFDGGLTRTSEDLFHRGASDRQFYTNPVTTIPNDAQGFAEWLYGEGRSKNEHSRQWTPA